jgi:hypothetical protein
LKRLATPPEISILLLHELCVYQGVRMILLARQTNQQIPHDQPSIPVLATFGQALSVADCACSLNALQNGRLCIAACSARTTLGP